MADEINDIELYISPEEKEQKEQERTSLAKKAMLEALRMTLGIVTPALDKSGVSRTAYYSWLKNDEDFRKEVDYVNEISLDFSESKMFEAIKNGDTTLIKFHLSTKGKDRGYVERAEKRQVDREGNDVIPTILDWKTAVNAAIKQDTAND